MLSAVVLLSIVGLSLASIMPQYEFVEEWNLWKGQHKKTYANDLEELDRHLVWVSNKKYIETHNLNSHVFGFNLAMNHFGDIVSDKNLSKFGYCVEVAYGNRSRK